MTSPLIEIKDVSFSFGGDMVLENVSFVIQKGDYVGVIGPNGGGKTTLLKILVGLLSPKSGTVTVSGMSPDVSRRTFEIGYVPQRAAQDVPSFPVTVYEIVESGRIAKKGLFDRMREADEAAIEKALAVAGIANLKDVLMSNLSGGQRQRAYMARALAGEPKILILDEPFVGVDVATQKEFYAFLRELNEKHGLTIIFVSHDIDVVTQEAKSILCLNRGLLCFGSSQLLKEPHVAEMLYGKKITHLHQEP